MMKFLQKMKRGFTLVELLVVIGVIGVLAAGLVAVINPADRIAYSNDTKVKADIQQIVGGLLAYSTSTVSNGAYPCAAAAATCPNTTEAWDAALVPEELTLVPVPPTGYGTGYTYAANVAGGRPTAFKLSGQLQSDKLAGVGDDDFWVYCSWNGTYAQLEAAPNATFTGACQ